MYLGLSLQNNWGIEDVQSIIHLARQAEEWGFASVWVHDHVFNAAHVFTRIGKKPYYEPLTLLSYVAACTQRVGLGTSVLVLPYHNPIRLAKTAATLDVLSGGRLILGVGVGGVPQESEAMGSPYAERGAITDEAIAIMKELWTKEDPSFSGKYHRFSGMPFSPKPLQKPHIPVLIGGNSRAAIRRAVRLGNGWHPFSTSPETVSEGINYLREYAQGPGGRWRRSRSLSASHWGSRRPVEMHRGLRHALLYRRSRRCPCRCADGRHHRQYRQYAEMLPAMEMLAREVLPVFQ